MKRLVTEIFQSQGREREFITRPSVQSGGTIKASNSENNRVGARKRSDALFGSERR